MKRLLFAICGLSFAAASTQAQITLAQWTFETTSASITGTSTAFGPLAPEIGLGAASGSHATAAVWSSPAGNGSPHSFSVNTWAVGDYFQFQTSAALASGISLSFDETSSGTGPRDFKLQYSVNGSSFTDFASYSVLANASPNPTWNGTTASSLYTFTYDLSSITALDGAPTIYFRLADNSTVSAAGGTVAVTGTDRVDNFTIVAANIVPEPSSIALAGLGLAGWTLLRRRR